MDRVLKTYVDTGLLPKRNDANFSMSDFENFFASNASKADKMRLMIRAGVYNLRSASTRDELLQDFYSPGSNAVTPDKVLAEMYKTQPKAPRDLPKARIGFQQTKELAKLKKMLGASTRSKPSSKSSIIQAQ